MDVSTITITKEDAVNKLKEFRSIAVSQRRAEDTEFKRLYRMAAKGLPLIDVSSAFRETGLNEKNEPSLAMARADWDTCFYHRSERTFSGSRRYARSQAFRIPRDAFDFNKTQWDLSTPVPFVPPNLRQKDDMSNYWILFEAKDWKRYSADPFLLKRVSGYIYAVLGEWDLTELERALLSNFRT